MVKMPAFWKISKNTATATTKETGQRFSSDGKSRIELGKYMYVCGNKLADLFLGQGVFRNVEIRGLSTHHFRKEECKEAH